MNDIKKIAFQGEELLKHWIFLESYSQISLYAKVGAFVQSVTISANILELTLCFCGGICIKISSLEGNV